MFLMFFSLVQYVIYNVILNITFLLFAGVNDKLSMYLPLEKKINLLILSAVRKSQ